MWLYLKMERKDFCKNPPFWRLFWSLGIFSQFFFFRKPSHPSTSIRLWILCQKKKKQKPPYDHMVKVCWAVLSALQARHEWFGPGPSGMARTVLECMSWPSTALASRAGPCARYAPCPGHAIMVGTILSHTCQAWCSRHVPGLACWRAVRPAF